MCTLPSEVTTGGDHRTVIEHLIGRISNALSYKALILDHLYLRQFSTSVFDNRPVSYGAYKPCLKEQA
jgi:hypothetical protein